MIVLPAVRAALTAALQGHLDLQVIPYLFEINEHVENRVLMFVDTIPGSKIDTTATYEIDQQCGANATRAYIERGTLLLWLAVNVPDDASSAAAAEEARGKILAKLTQTVAADHSLGVDMPGVDQVRVHLVSVDTRSEAMAVAGGQPAPAARAAIDLSVEAHITPALLATT